MQEMQQNSPHIIRQYNTGILKLKRSSPILHLSYLLCTRHNTYPPNLPIYLPKYSIS